MQEQAKVRSFAEWSEEMKAKYPPHKAPEWLKITTGVVAIALEIWVGVMIWFL